jgi:cobalt/nickel transport system permease protein
VPLFSGVIAIPALFLIDGEPVLRLLTIGPINLTISDNALLSVATFLSRVSVSVTLAVVLVVTTRWADLLKAMRVYRVPEVFIVIISMTYRYIFLLLRIVENLFLARASRTVGVTTGSERRRWVGATAGNLLSKSFKTSSDVYQAMVARGFTGNVRTIQRFVMRDEDWLFLTTAIVLLGSLLLFDLSLR